MKKERYLKPTRPLETSGLKSQTCSQEGTTRRQNFSLIVSSFRTDNCIKNQFYSTLRRQLRKINRIMGTKAFEKILGGKIPEITTEDLYKYLKEGKIDYDDIKGMYERSIAYVGSAKAKELKSSITERVKSELKSELKADGYNRRSSRISKKDRKEKDDVDIAVIAFLVLVEMCRIYRTDNKDQLPALEASIPYGMDKSRPRSDHKRKSGEKPNKRTQKEERKNASSSNEQTDSPESGLKNEYEMNFGKPLNKDLVPNSMRSLFSKMKQVESGGNNSDEDLKGKPEIEESSFKPPPLLKNPSGSTYIKGFYDGNNQSRENSEIKISYQPNISKPKFLIEESDPNALGYKLWSKEPPMTTSMPKNMNFAGDGRNVSNNSAMSQSFAYQNFDFPFANKMNLSKPSDMNFDQFNMMPNTSSFAANMLSKPLEVTPKPAPTVANRQIQLLINITSGGAPNNFQTINLNSLSGAINLNFDPHKRISIEMKDESQLEIKTVDKSELSNHNTSSPHNIFANKFNNHGGSPKNYPKMPGGAVNDAYQRLNRQTNGNTTPPPGAHFSSAFSTAQNLQPTGAKPEPDLSKEDSDLTINERILKERIKGQAPEPSQGKKKPNSNPLYGGQNQLL